jgi:hypothetical protein
MRGDTDAHPVGLLEELLATAEEEGSLTATEIAAVLDAPELPIDYETECSLGRS